MRLSKFGQKLAKDSGINRLMDDLGKALDGTQDMLMLGGGNPSHIPQVEERFRKNIQAILDNRGEFEHVIGDYDTPQGSTKFIEALAQLLHREFGWDISPANIALTNGSQAAFFFLFNMFAGDCDDGIRRKILLPLCPEYIGYADQGLVDNMFVSQKPDIEHLDDHLYKYYVNFDTLEIGDDIGAMCVSRPTNPTGNVLTDEEIKKLTTLARSKNIPFIIDNAYGAPFPNIIFTDVKPEWNDTTILCMSLSKLGLPAARTGIIIATEEIIMAVSAMNAVISLAPNSVGPALSYDLVKSGEVIALSREVIRPFYERKAFRAVEQLTRELKGVDFHIHKPEGALFLWLWFRGLPITSQQLYERLKNRGVLVVPGHYFFPGLQEEWEHTHECIRVTTAQNDTIVQAGLSIIADEVKRAYSTVRT